MLFSRCCATTHWVMLPLSYCSLLSTPLTLLVLVTATGFGGAAVVSPAIRSIVQAFKALAFLICSLEQ